jgi:DtxR family Mn-dependent transcriptional regulator
MEINCLNKKTLEYLMYNEAIEDYLKKIYEIQEESGKVATTVLAKKLGIAPASATGMIKKLSDMNLITHQKYQGVELTKAGEKIALEVIRHHRLIELFLSEALGVPWDKVHEEAEKWEHVLSEEMEDRIDKLLGFPTSDPHGSPIPQRNGEMNDHATLHLADLKIGDKATIAEVSDLDPELLRYVGKLGLYPETKICVNDIAPFDGPFEISTNDQELTIGRKAANHILVKDVEK